MNDALLSKMVDFLFLLSAVIFLNKDMTASDKI